VPPAQPVAVSSDEETLYQRFKARLMKEAPALLRLLSVVPEIEILESRETIELDGKSIQGQLAKLISRGFFDEAKNGNTVFNELKRVGASVAKPNAYKGCDKLTAMGFLTKEANGYQAVAGMKSHITRS